MSYGGYCGLHHKNLPCPVCTSAPITWTVPPAAPQVIGITVVPGRYLAWLTSEEVELVQAQRDGTEGRKRGEA
jgi:hypothetical protein